MTFSIINPPMKMKKIIVMGSFHILGLILPFTMQAQVAIGTGSPHSSATLDVQGTTGGLLAPRMTSAQRSAVPGPAEGLLIYDTDTHSFWYYYNSAWHELFYSESNGTYIFGDAPNYTLIESDGTLVFYGNATVFNDFVVPTNAAKAGGNSPAFEQFRNNGSGSVGGVCMDLC